VVALSGTRSGVPTWDAPLSPVLGRCDADQFDAAAGRGGAEAGATLAGSRHAPLLSIHRALDEVQDLAGRIHVPLGQEHVIGAPCQ